MGDSHEGKFGCPYARKSSESLCRDLTCLICADELCADVTPIDNGYVCPRNMDVTEILLIFHPGINKGQFYNSSHYARLGYKYLSIITSVIGHLMVYFAISTIQGGTVDHIRAAILFPNVFDFYPLNISHG